MHLVLKGKTWVSFYLSLLFSLILDRSKKFEWDIYQLFLSLLLWVVGHGQHSPQIKWRTTCGHQCSFIQGVLGPITFWIFFFSFGANSKLLGEVTRVPELWTILEHLTSESSPRTQSLSWAPSDTVSFPNTWTRNIPELRLTLTKSFTVLICKVSWPGKSRYVNMQSCCKLIATNLNVRLICARFVSNE